MHETKVTLEPRHDFQAKLQGRTFFPAVARYIAWQRAVRIARAKNEPEPPMPADWVPLSINLDLTTSCNYRCPHCTDVNVLNQPLVHDYGELMRSLEHLTEHGLRSVILIGGGESTLHPKFKEVVRFLKERKVQVAVVSNGSRADVVCDVAPFFTPPDWVRFSLDAGTDDTFQPTHLPRHPVTLEEICSWVPKIRERNSALAVGFSFIIVWPGAKGPATAKDPAGKPLIPNIHEMVLAAKLARDNRFTYISFKPYLARRPEGTEVMDPSVIANFDETIELIKRNIAEAKAYESPDFRVVESTNLRVLLAGIWRDFTMQPHTCHMQAFRQVLSPTGLINCPAYRDVREVPEARIATKRAYVVSEREGTARSVARILTDFDPSVRCREVTCLYQPTNWWLEQVIAGEDTLLPGEILATDCFL
jgi:hypothetical protein